MTKSAVKEATTSVVIPSTVALALIAIVAKLYAGPVGGADNQRLTALETRYIELERQSREKWDMTMEKLAIIQAAIARMEGKLDK